MPGGGCSGGIPGLGPCMTPGPGRVITPATGEPSWSVHIGSEGSLSALESSVESSGRFSLPAVKKKKHEIRFY